MLISFLNTCDLFIRGHEEQITYTPLSLKVPFSLSALNGLVMSAPITNNPVESDGVQPQQDAVLPAHDVQVQAQPNSDVVNLAMNKPRQIKVKTSEQAPIAAASVSKSNGSTNQKAKVTATVQPFDLDPVPFPSAELKTRLQADDLKDELLMTICSAFASVENRALCPKEIAAVCMKLGWECT